MVKGFELRERLSPYLGDNCFRLTKDERDLLAQELSKRNLSPETFGSWVRNTYSPATLMCTKGNPRDILNPFSPAVWEEFNKWVKQEQERTYHKEVSRTHAAMSLILAHGETLGVRDALSQGSDALIIFRVLEAAGSPLASQYKEDAERVLTEKPWRNIL